MERLEIELQTHAERRPLCVDFDRFQVWVDAARRHLRGHLSNKQNHRNSIWSSFLIAERVVSYNNGCNYTGMHKF